MIDPPAGEASVVALRCSEVQFSDGKLLDHDFKTKLMGFPQGKQVKQL